MPGIVIPSASVAWVAWAKANAPITAQVGSRVFSTKPTNITFPFVTVGRITGVPQIREAPIDFARLQLNVWGGTKDNGLPNWVLADEPARVIEAEIRAFAGASIGDAYISEMAPFEGMQQLENPDTRDARFWMDALVVVRRADGQ